MTSACTSRDKETENPAEVVSEPQDVTITAVDYRYSQAPTQLSGGVIDLTFENQGEVTHEVALTGIGDSTPEQFMEDLGGGNGLDGSAFPEYVDQVAVPDVFAKAQTTTHATFTLTEGNYALWCAFTDAAKGDETDGAAHYQLGMVQGLTVSGGPAQPVLPEADGTITATDYGLEVDIEAGDETVNFVNQGPDQLHLSTVEMYPKGVDAAEAEEAFRTQLEPGPSPKGVPGATGLGFSGIYSEGLGGTFRLYMGRFVSGRTYLFECYMFDRTGGEPHMKEYGQWAIVTIE
jgi:hypothetical protein